MSVTTAPAAKSAIASTTDFIARLRLPSPRPRRLRWSVERTGTFTVVRDGGTPIAVVVRDTGTGGALLEVLKFSPDAPDVPLVLPPYDHHYATRIGYGATFNWSMDAMFQSPEVEDTLELTEQDESHLLFVHAGRFKDGTTLRASLRIGYDEQVGQYSYDLTWDVVTTRTVGAEFANIFHRNLMHSDMRQREFDYGCYVRADEGAPGGSRWERYPVTTMVTGLQQNRLTGIDVPLGGGAGHVNRSGVIPMLVVRRANVPIRAGSCNVCYDLHTYAMAKANQPTHVEARFADVGPIAKANPDALRTIELDDERRYPFKHGEVCDFESTVGRGEPWAGGIWATELVPGSAIVEGVAHRGRRSLRLEWVDGQDVVEISPFISAFVTKNHTESEMSAWVKLDGDTDQTEASIELRQFRFSAANPVTRGVASVFGKSDWIKLTVRANSWKVETALPYLRLRGRGRAWFDEILVREI